MYGIRFKDYGNMDSLQIEKIDLEVLNNTLSFHKMYICQYLNIEQIEYDKILINEFNAINYDYRKRLKDGDFFFYELLFKNKEDAEKALDWLISKVLIIKLSDQNEKYDVHHQQLNNYAFIGRFERESELYSLCPKNGYVACINNMMFTFDDGIWKQIINV